MTIMLVTPKDNQLNAGLMNMKMVQGSSLSVAETWQEPRLAPVGPRPKHWQLPIFAHGPRAFRTKNVPSMSCRTEGEIRTCKIQLWLSKQLGQSLMLDNHALQGNAANNGATYRVRSIQ